MDHATLVQRLKDRQAILGRVQFAEDAVHQVTGRSDQSVYDIVRANPKHDAVISWNKAMKELSDFDAESQKELKHA
jgi:hypothetical protein